MTAERLRNMDSVSISEPLKDTAADASGWRTSSRLRNRRMRQKYRICRWQKKKTLNIKEFAVVEKDTKNVASTMLRDDHFDLICEQNYDGETIARSAAAGSDQLVDALRTPNLYPIAPYVEKIAESVVDLLADDQDRCVDLFFDDRELVAVDSTTSP
jgi:hypothetical protein